MQFFEDELDTDRVYQMDTGRKLVPKETELSDMKLDQLGK